MWNVERSTLEKISRNFQILLSFLFKNRNMRKFFDFLHDDDDEENIKFQSIITHVRFHCDDVTWNDLHQTFKIAFFYLKIFFIF
jgi:hypothetical protein